MQKENYHTHTYLCHHAIGEIEDYVSEAIKLKFTHLGISDHGPLFCAGFPRMTLEDFYDIYVPSFKASKEKHKNDIKLYLGLEIEYFYNQDSYYEKLLEDLDYLILGCHYYSGYVHKNETSAYECNTKQKVDEYVKLINDALQTGYFKILAHPDFFLNGVNIFDSYIEEKIREIILSCIKNNVYLELNCNGFDRGMKDFGTFIDYSYPNRRFFEIASEYKDLKIIVSSDAHRPIDLDKNFKKGYEMLEDLNIKPYENPLD